MRWPVIILSFFVVAVVETGCANYVKLLSVAPELLVILIVYFALNSTREVAMTCGIIGGILKVSCYGVHPFILLIYASIGFIIGSFKEALNRQLPLAQALLSFTAVLYSGILYNILLSSMGFSYFRAIFLICVPTAFYTALLTPIMFKAFHIVIPSGEIEYKEIVFKKKVFEGRRPQ